MKLIVVMLLICLVTACTDSKKVPKDILARPKMEKVMWDMLLADRFSSNFILKDSATKDVKLETFKLYEQVFQIHGISKEEFLKSYKYYLNRPDLSKIMFDSLAVRSGRVRNEIFPKLVQ
ncbi:MAG: DUF4296 domain-containing protein [Chitinophagaceae bacterium]|nr:DUF4296 domain-containing protein [Chitinophagaceae bacterium]